jgi:peptidyl-prolyl cis-trans isomerase D
MALIGKIRKNPLIVLLFIGGGIALFVLSEMTSGAGGPIGPVENAMGRIGEMEIDRAEFERTLSSVYSGGDAYQNRDNLWQFYVNEGLVTQEASDMGLTVSEQELTDLEFGPNPSPVIRRNFSDPATGQLNRQFLTEVQGYLDRGDIDQGIADRKLSPNFRSIWKYQRREITAQRLQEKMSAMVSKAMYAPSWQAQDFANQQISSRRLAVVKVPFEEVQDDAVSVGDEAIQAYMDENRSLFVNPEESRSMNYVTFNVVPTEADSAALRDQLNVIAEEWKSETNDSLFALANNGSYAGVFYAETALSPVIADVVLEDMNVGEIYGPYVEGNAMKLVKLVDRKVMSDSAKTRHILRNATTPDQFDEANRMIDSLMTVLNGNRGKFAALAEEFSQDPGSASNGGVYEKVTPGQFVRPFDKVLFQTGTVGRLYKVTTQFGVHLVEVMSRSRSTSPRVKVAYAVESILPSNETEDAVLSEAQQFLNGKGSLEELKAAAEAAGMEVSNTGPLPMSNYALAGLGSGQEVRDMMCWAFSADPGDVSGIVYTFTDPQLFYENNYVLVGLEDVIPAGMAPVDAVRESLLPIVRNRAKGQNLAPELSGKDLMAIASEFGATVDTLNNVNPTLSSLPNGLGREPKVIAAAAILPTGQVSDPIIGETGVYAIKALTDAPQVNSGNLPGARQQINTTVRLQAESGLIAGMRVGADVEDQRSATECR